MLYSLSLSGSEPSAGASAGATAEDGGSAWWDVNHTPRLRLSSLLSREVHTLPSFLQGYS